MHTDVKELRRKVVDEAGKPTYIVTELRFGFRIPKGEMQEAKVQPRLPDWAPCYGLRIDVTRAVLS